MKKNRLIILLLALQVSRYSVAATCPPVNSFDPQNPPVGWSLLLPPMIEGQDYHFGKAVHSLNGSFYYQQIICEYEACESFLCPAFEILSDSAYTQPQDKTPPWNTRPTVAHTLVCAPPNHDPTICVFG